jgi:hypothetical protein
LLPNSMFLPKYQIKQDNKINIFFFFLDLIWFEWCDHPRFGWWSCIFWSMVGWKHMWTTCPTWVFTLNICRLATCTMFWGTLIGRPSSY